MRCKWALQIKHEAKEPWIVFTRTGMNLIVDFLLLIVSADALREDRLAWNLWL